MKIESVIHSLLIHLVEVSDFVYSALEVKVCNTFLLVTMDLQNIRGYTLLLKIDQNTNH